MQLADYALFLLIELFTGLGPKLAGIGIHRLCSVQITKLSDTTHSEPLWKYLVVLTHRACLP